MTQLLLELGHHSLEVLARVGVEQLARLGVVAVAVHPGHARVPGQGREGVEVGHGRQLGLLGAEPDVVPQPVDEQVGGGAVDQLIALLGHLGKERRHHALAHHAARDRHLLEEDVLDPLGLDPAGDLLDALAPPWLVARLLEGGGGGRGAGGPDHRSYVAPEGRGRLGVDGNASLVGVGHSLSSGCRVGGQAHAAKREPTISRALSKLVIFVRRLSQRPGRPAEARPIAGTGG